MKNMSEQEMERLHSLYYAAEGLAGLIQHTTKHEVLFNTFSTKNCWTQKPKFLIVDHSEDDDVFCARKNVETLLHEYCHWLVATNSERAMANLGLDSLPHVYLREGEACCLQMDVSYKANRMDSYGLVAQEPHDVYEEAYNNTFETYDEMVKHLTRRAKRKVSRRRMEALLNVFRIPHLRPHS